MKKSIIPALVILLTSTLLSCNKEILEQPETVNEKVKSSDWFSMSFQLITTTPTTRNIVFLTAERPVMELNAKNNPDLVPLAFVKSPITGMISSNDINRFRYSPLPSVLKTENENSDFSFELVSGNFTVKIYNAEQANLEVREGQFDSYSFRYILVPKALYENTKIDWKNYEQVASLLNLRP